MFDAVEDTEVSVELQVSSKVFNYTPDLLIETQTKKIHKGVHTVQIDFTKSLGEDQYAFLIFRRNPSLSIRCTKIALLALYLFSIKQIQLLITTGFKCHQKTVVSIL